MEKQILRFAQDDRRRHGLALSGDGLRFAQDDTEGGMALPCRGRPVCRPDWMARLQYISCCSGGVTVNRLMKAKQEIFQAELEIRILRGCMLQCLQEVQEIDNIRRCQGFGDLLKHREVRPV